MRKISHQLHGRKRLGKYDRLQRQLFHRAALRASRLQTATDATAFEDLTDAIVQSQAAAGTLNPAILEALLLAVRHPVGEGGR